MADHDTSRAGDAYASSSGLSSSLNPDSIDLAYVWSLLKSGKWVIALVTAVAVAIGIFYVSVVHPVYRADALLQIKSNQSSSPLSGVTSDLQEMTGRGSSSSAQADMRIIQSRKIVGETVDELNLSTHVRPSYFPIVGWAIATRRSASTTPPQPVSLDAGFWPGGYAWQPSHVEISEFTLPSEYYGRRFTLRALGGGRYVLNAPNGDVMLEGQVGQLATSELAVGGTIRLFVTDIRAGGAPTDFKLWRDSDLFTINVLRSRLQVSEDGDDTGIVQIALQGGDRQQITEIVNSIAQNYLQQNVEAKSEQAQQSLNFLDQQLPELKADVEQAEQRLSNYQESNSGAVNLDATGQALLDQAIGIENQIAQVKMRIAQLRQNYTDQHPSVDAAQQQLAQLRSQQEEIQSRVGGLPEAQREVLSLRRTLEVNTRLYTGLLNRAQELRVAKAGTVGDVRIIDKAVLPLGRVSPQTLPILLLALVAGLILGAGLVFLRAAFRRGVDNPKDIETRLGLPLYAVLPLSPWLVKRTERAKRRRDPAPLLARDQSDDVTVEALRSLRTSLFFAQMESASNVVMITGPSPGVGKSFVSMNLAYLLSQADQSVVVVDADMRKGRVHEFMKDREREPGLSQVLSEQVELDDALRTVEGTDVTVLTSGKLPPNPSELLMREPFTRLISRLRERFDLVILDAPPILAVTDASVMAAAVKQAVTFMVLRAGAHSIQEVEEGMQRFSRQGQSIAGVVFNAYTQKQADVTGGYHYTYEYK